MDSKKQQDRFFWFTLIPAGLALELLFLRMHTVYYLKNHAVSFIELALAAGLVYLIALYGFARTHATRDRTILLIFLAIAFRAPLWTLPPTLSDDLQRYRWEGKVQAHGWNPYVIAPKDPRLAARATAIGRSYRGAKSLRFIRPCRSSCFGKTGNCFPDPSGSKSLLNLRMFWSSAC